MSNRLAQPTPSRRATRRPTGSPSPRSRTGCATLIRSMPATSSSWPHWIPLTCHYRRRSPRRSMIARRIHDAVRKCPCPKISWARCSASAKDISPVDGETRSACTLVAALPADRALGRQMGGRAPRRHRGIAAEIRGKSKSPRQRRMFTLSARADRIERHGNGYAILDYKTANRRPESRYGWDYRPTSHAGGSDLARAASPISIGRLHRRARLCPVERQ